MLKSKNVEKLEERIEKANNLKIRKKDKFVNGLKRDMQAVRNVIIYEYNNGLAEGSVNKVKVIKRIMCGRNKFEMQGVSFMFKRIIKVVQEYYIYKKLKKIEKQYKDNYIFLIPSHIGDVYATFSLLNSFKRKYNANRITVLIDKKFEFLVQMFPVIDNYVHIPAKYCDIFAFGYLGTIVGTRRPQIGKIIIGEAHTILKLGGINDWTVFDLWPLQLGLSNNSSYELPTLYNCTNIKLKEHLDQMFFDKKVIYLFTNARSMEISKEFPEYLRKLLTMALESGYEIVFNEPIAENFFESFIPKYQMTKIHFLHVNLEDIIYVAEYFKNVIVFRSGVADLLTSANVRMVVLYLGRYWNNTGYPIKYIDYYSLKKFKKRGQVLEMELINIDDTVCKTLDFFENKNMA
jgi:ADP-heptose:LPS heptosyltransferase